MTSRDALERPDALARDGRAQGACDQPRGAMELPGMGQGLGARAKRSRTAERPGKAPPLAARLPRRFARSQRRSASGHSPRRDTRESRRASGYAPWGAAVVSMAPPRRPRAHAHAAPGPAGPGGDVQRRAACPLEGWPEVSFHWCSMGGRQIGGVLTVRFCRFGAVGRRHGVCALVPRLSESILYTVVVGQRQLR